ncbi:MAG: hypothetical protein INH41_09510 [Myxococcaceae bacterium]|nr:hypothetical protein [Myxococcaceae bacterium]
MTPAPRVALAVVVALGLWACEARPRPTAEPPPLEMVPGSYHLARPAPGHQRHLATGLVRGDGGLVDSGSAQVRCRDCHALTDAGFAAPTEAVCAGCHQPQQRQHHPFDAGASTPGCLTCHPFVAKALPARFERWTCMACHQQPQAAHAAITVHRADCEACHRPHEAPFTRAADCATCHDVTLRHGAKGPTLAETCMACHPHHTPAAAASGRCLSCHAKPTLPATARVSPQALSPKAHAGCGACHEAHRFERGAVKPCAACHPVTPVVAGWVHDACTDCHRPHAPAAAPVGCTEGCHRDEAVTHPPAAEGPRCTGCHAPHEAGDQLAKPCVSCHDAAPFTAAVVHGARMTCDDCHAPHEGRPRDDAECRGCHQARFDEVAQVTVKPGARQQGHLACAGCHASLPHGAPGAPPRACLDCHADRAPPQPGHPACGSCHESHSGAVVKACTACHAPAALPALHREAGHQRCEACHAPHTPEPGATPTTCRACHQRLDPKRHPTPPAQCVGCHLFTDASPGTQQRLRAKDAPRLP